MENQLIEKFNNYEIRIIKDEEGIIWFVAKDICRILDIKNNRSAIENIPAKNKGAEVFSTPGGPQTMSTINKRGLIRLLYRSNKQSQFIEEFQDWVDELVEQNLDKFINKNPKNNLLLDEKIENKRLENEKLKKENEKLTLDINKDIYEFLHKVNDHRGQIDAIAAIKNMINKDNALTSNSNNEYTITEYISLFLKVKLNQEQKNLTSYLGKKVKKTYIELNKVKPKADNKYTNTNHIAEISIYSLDDYDKWIKNVIYDFYERKGLPLNKYD